VFLESGSGKSFGPFWSKGDRIGCGVNFGNGEVFFTRNGEFLGKVATLSSGGIYHFCVGFRSYNARVHTNMYGRDLLYNYDSYFQKKEETMDRPLKMAILICNNCLSIEFPGCGKHQYILNSLINDEVAQCAAPGCNVNTSHWEVCRFCEKQKPQMRIHYIYPKELLFAFAAILKEKEDLVPVACLLCPSCKVLEFPGNYLHVNTIIKVLKRH
jgi:hypothetical protein